ncbi:MAG TPA: prolyl oligopeptidase family serine peptidase [Polyangia bacterium]
MKRPLVSFPLTLLACSFVFAIAVAAGSARAQTGPTDPYAGMEGRLFTGQAGFTLPYRLAKPPAYDAANKYPLVIFLHGSGESGTDNRLQVSKNIGTNTPGSIFTTAANQAKFPSFLIAPQCPSPAVGWASGNAHEAVLKLITAMQAEFSIDTNRLYLTGLSMGGIGTWSLIEEHPAMFAAAIPMSGIGDPTMAAKIVRIPIWDFHGAMDPSVNVSNSRNMIAALRAAGGNPFYTEYPNGQHDIWFMGYTTPELLPWMNVQRLGALDPTGDGGVPVIPDGGAGDVATGAGGGGGSTAGTSGSDASTTSGAAGNGAAGTTGSGGGSGGASVTGAAGQGAGGATTGVAGSAGAGGTTGTGGSAAGTRSSSGGSGCAVADARAGSPTFVGLALALLALARGGRRRRR